MNIEISAKTYFNLCYEQEFIISHSPYKHNVKFDDLICALTDYVAVSRDIGNIESCEGESWEIAQVYMMNNREEDERPQFKGQKVCALLDYKDT